MSSEVNGVPAVRVRLLTRVLAAALLAVLPLAGCGGPDEDAGGAGSENGDASGDAPARDEADVRRAVTTHASNVAWSLGRSKPVDDEDVAALPCDGTAGVDDYSIRGRFAVTATPDVYEGGLDRLRQQWEQLGWSVDTVGSGATISKVTGQGPGADGYRIAVSRTGPPPAFRIDVTSPCYTRPKT